MSLLTPSYSSSMSSSSLADPSDPIVEPQPKFPHTRAQLAAIARQQRTNETDSDAEGDDFSGRGVPSHLVNKVVNLLVDEREDDLKALLKQTYGTDDETAEQNVLDLMHKHRDDVAGVPFLFLTPTRRPISRPSSRASTHSARIHNRPATPNSAPGSPLATIFRRPHTPLASPLAYPREPTSYMTAKAPFSEYSPNSSPVLAHATAAQAQYTASLPASPLSSPRLLNAKANEFKPIPRPLSAASSNPSIFRAESPDLWSHNSPRATSNLAIAAPLLPDQSLLATPPLHSSSSLRSSYLSHELEEGEDPFDPFDNKDASPFTFHSIANSINEFEAQWQQPSESSLLYNGSTYAPQQDPQGQVPTDESQEAELDAVLTDGMTPFDVLSSVFGTTLAPSELEDALANNGYDFERAMSWLIEKVIPTTAAVPQGPRMPPRQPMGGGVTVVPRDGSIRGGRGFQSPPGRAAPRYLNGRPVQTGNRVCRYFVAGECLRADCRFSHDLERALCRFWLRGTCAKNEQCEFLHHLPKDVDLQQLSTALARANVPPGTGPLASHPAAQQLHQHQPPPDDFPALGAENGQNGRRAPYAPYDPSRTRFAAAVKKPAAEGTNGNLAARREVMGLSAIENLHHRSAIVAPRPSPRLKLRPPALLPTLPTGESLNNLYMSYRNRALQLGAARNACLSRAADAWRRGDGAAAKRFSREGHDLNAKMAKEMASAASSLVKERARMTEGAVRAREQSWSDDPLDRTWRGRTCGGGLGVVLGVASDRDVGEKLSGEEKMEAVLDLHGLHSNEATEVLEQFLLGLENEHFLGIAYLVVGEEKHTGTQDPARGASRSRLATGVREWLHRWGYPWSEREGIIYVDPLTHHQE
ncbi:hypothetical protein EV122DRAFT_215920 [Schizophyllum commune]